MSIEKMGLIAKSMGSELRFKLYKMLIENKNREIPVFELSKMIDSSYRNVQIHLQFFADAGIVEINSEKYPMTVRLLKSVHFLEKMVTEAKKEGIDKFAVHETLTTYASAFGGFEEITGEEEIIKIAKSLSNDTRTYIMQVLYNNPKSSIPQIEKLLRGTMYESSYRNVAQHVDKLVEAGIARVVKDTHAREKRVDLEKIIKIETLDVKS